MGLPEPPVIEAHIHEWLNLVVRWIRMITGIAWIGASFYFNWVEGQLNRRGPNPTGIAGDLWAVHGGGFYHSQKYQVAPEKLPEKLHWFKWEAYMTWVSGMALLVIVYFWQAEAHMVDPAVADLSPAEYGMPVQESLNFDARDLGEWNSSVLVRSVHPVPESARDAPYLEEESSRYPVAELFDKLLE